MKVLCNSAKPPLGGAFAVELFKSLSEKIELEWSNESTVSFGGAKPAVNFTTSNDLIRILGRNFRQPKVSGNSALEKTLIDHWLTFSLTVKNEIEYGVKYLDNVLGPFTFLLGNELTVADLAVFSELHTLSKFNDFVKTSKPKNVMRWIRLIESQPPVVKVLGSLPEPVKDTLFRENAKKSPGTCDNDSPSGRLQEGKFVDLPEAEMGKVVVRFPPEASGYLHIGHAKAALLNQYYQQAFQGKLIMRFDDTNPAKENVHFEKVILEDVELLELKPDMFTHTSQYFDLMLGMCERLIKEGKAFVDDTPGEQMKSEREQKVNSANSSNSVEKNLQLWSEMIKGSDIGVKCCVRAKIDMQSPNGCLRDPTIYRCKPEPHPRTGTQYKVYPTYDFACPIVDSIEGVTHTLRTMEYHDRDPQFYWFIDALGLRKPYIWEYSRLSMTNTVLSKRKLTWFVEQGLVDGWDDPRMPTVRGVLRRGMTVEGLRQFIQAQGSSRSVVFMEWDKIWAINKKVIDPVAPRYTALEVSPSPVPVTLKGVKDDIVLQVPLHHKNAAVGTKQVHVAPRLLIDKVDAEALKEGENTTFINYGNVTIDKINKSADGNITSVEATPNIDNKDYKKTLKVTWLGDTKRAPLIPTYCVFFDHIISKALLSKDEDFKNYIGHNTRMEVEMLGDPCLSKLKAGDIIQLQRRGFFRVDVAYAPRSEHTGRETPCILFHIPDGHTKGQPVITQAVSSTQKEKTVAKRSSANGDAEALNDQITKQGDLVRTLKGDKADKVKVDEAVKQLLALKTQYKTATGQDWKPGAASPSIKPASQSTPASTNVLPVVTLLQNITSQGDLVRKLKAEKAEKSAVDAAVKQLLALKASYKDLTGTDWTPKSQPPPAPTTTAPSSAPGVTEEVNAVLDKIAQQGDLVRKLKADKADKSTVDSTVKQLLALKASYKDLTGTDWTPKSQPPPASTATAPSLAPGVTDEVSPLLAKISQQGDLVRKLKTDKADKSAVDAAVKELLALKASYKKVTGTDWSPNVKAPLPTQPSTAVQTSAASVPGTRDQQEAAAISAKITEQGDKIRKLKEEKKGKAAIAVEVQTLLYLKATFKTATGMEWSPNVTLSTIGSDVPTSAPTLTTGSTAQLSEKIAEQGDKVRTLKEQKADKKTLEPEIQTLLALKKQYKETAGTEWKPQLAGQTPAKVNSSASVSDILEKIKQRDEAVKKLKSSVSEEEKALLQLQVDYKKLTGQEWKAGTEPASAPKAMSATMEINSEKDALTEKITKQGNLVRDLKSKKADKSEIDAAVKSLLALKEEFAKLTGAPPAVSQPPRKEKKKETTPVPKDNKKNKKSEQNVKDEPAAGALKKVTRLGLEARKDTDLPEWYSQVITKGEMIEYYDVSGCYILRPWSYAIWEVIRQFLSTEFKKLGIKDCYFPIFVSKAALEREKDHIADFAPEVAWVTHSGSSELAEHIAVRPTSETVMYPAYAKWIQSHRDLPLRLNQWNNIVRWEFQHPQPFIRTREFLWQEGHTAFSSKEPADTEVLQILDLYARVYTEYLALPVVKGRKTEKEKFAGGDYTTTVEAFVPASGRGIQGATSHHLGQNFSKMFDIIYDDPETQEKKYVYQNSWGLTTRTIGVMILVHGDDQGLVLPPRVASVQVVVVPCGVSASASQQDREVLREACVSLERDLTEAGVRAEGDYRDNYSPGWKFNHWELKGVPIRVEIGPKDMANKQLVAVKRFTGEKLTLKRDSAVQDIVKLLNDIHDAMLNKATSERESRTKVTSDWNEFTTFLDQKCILLSPFCGETPCEDLIKKESARVEAADATDTKAPAMGAKTLCIPLEQPRALNDSDKCIHPACQNKAKFFTLFGRSY